MGLSPHVLVAWTQWLTLCHCRVSYSELKVRFGAQSWDRKAMALGFQKEDANRDENGGLEKWGSLHCPLATLNCVRRVLPACPVSRPLAI